MLLLPAIVLVAQFSGIIALPLQARENKAAKTSSAAGTVTPANAEGDEVGMSNISLCPIHETLTDPSSSELNGAFGTSVALGGGNIKTDVLFPKGVRHPA